MHNAQNPEEITQLLESSYHGDDKATEQLIQKIYPKLHAIVKNQLKSEAPNITQQVTDIAHDTYEKLAHQNKPYNDRRHFYAIIACASRQVIIDHIRRKKTLKRKAVLADIDLQQPQSASLNTDLLDIDSALKKLSAIHPEAAELMELRYFGGLTMEELADYYDLSIATIKRKWSFAKLNLQRFIDK